MRRCRAWFPSRSGRSGSPIHKIDQIQSPTFVPYVENDTPVPVVEAEQAVENLKRRNVPVEYLLFPDEGHGWRTTPNRLRSTVEIMRFFQRHPRKELPAYRHEVRQTAS